MRLRSRNSRSMERGTNTARPTACGNASQGPKHALRVGTNSIMRSPEAGELVKFQSGLTQNGKARSGNCGRLGKNVQFWPAKCPKHAPSENGESYAASFVTKECAISLDCDPTIFISCQS